MSTSARRLAVGPEHPRYIDIREPPQQTAPYRPGVKGVLPVPRNVFTGSGRHQDDDEALAASSQLPRTTRRVMQGSREEWRERMSDVRRQNLREGLKSLRRRQVIKAEQRSVRSAARQRQREEMINRPEREDERLTTPSNNLDLEKLLKGGLPDPTREERLAIKARNLDNHLAAKREERMDALHTLYLNARDFIVTPKQLEKAVDDAFGTPEKPVVFGGGAGSERSIWAQGRPRTVQDMLNRANRQATRFAIDNVPGYTEINKDRMQRIAEGLTGGKMDSGNRN